ncbi:MAG: tetratricopeptide repeat protein [Polyangiaceae bacterium]|nr:tetratricopeptide repeat protein [Polyangiaceae bacterium]
MGWSPRVAVAPRALVLALALAGCVSEPTERRVRAHAYLRAGDASSALAECDLGLRASPREPGLLVLRGDALVELERPDEARATYEDARTAAVGREPEALYRAEHGLAILASRRADWPEARQRFEALLRLQPDDPTARVNLARVCLALRDLPCAVAEAERAGHSRGDAEDVLFTLGRIYTVAGDLDAAERTFEHICAVVPGAASCPYGVALVAAQRGDKARALDRLAEAIRRRLPHPEELAKDSLLAPLAAEPEFQALVASAASAR